MNKLKTIIQLFKALRNKKFIGDIALLKAALLSPSENLSLKKKTQELLENNRVQPKLEDLARYTEGSLGKEYYHFIKKNNLDLLNFSSNHTQLLQKYPVSARYIQLHDLYHVLLGFDTSILGELAVYSFIRQKEYSSTLNSSYSVAKAISFILYIFNLKLLKEFDNRGRQLGLTSKELISVDWHKRLQEPLADLRKEFQIEV